MKKLEEQSLFIPVGNDNELHLKRFYSNPEGKPVLLLHGSVESGRIFYSLTQKGWGPFLARNGYDVFIPDTRGRGESRPPVKRGTNYGNPETILDDMPLILNAIQEIKGNGPMHWMAHSWGGIQMLCFLARFPETPVSSMVFFSAVRLKRVKNLARFLNINLGYNIFLRIVANIMGYFPAKSLNVGSENEFFQQFEQTRVWIMKRPWKSPRDEFDYATQIPETRFPPTLYLAGAGDVFMGHPDDVKITMQEVGQSEANFWILGKKNGFSRDYGHNDSLFHKNAVNDHFPKILEWLIKIDS